MSGPSPRRFDTPRHHSRLRLSVMVVVGLAVAVLVTVLGDGVYAPVFGWAAASATYLIWVWAVIGRLDATATSAHARREDPGRGLSDALVLTATVASFAGVGLILIDASHADGNTKSLIVALALGSIALSWFLVHTLFTLRYASLFYRDRAGVDFNQEKPPMYADFAYLAFTVGMAFQVSDTALKTDAVRGTVLRHGLLSYLLGAIVLATTINLVSGLTH
ncbi:DUF1345 domain-containing protein [Tersicoccus sp. Bi-70]|uniref:DUF1345 domain-containing protein n=1 Tax=Tersicoccus sp. Bi-70 TaxID=1897634 RepID=UPI00097610B5|nr:DUF1345 domain-containing protein [Tersicoccus sp. Bi-70]OMH34142.1 hypothetical protein BGP79_03020 [Tersicoccus sp. Bi-70]